MNITPTELAAQYERALADWPFVPGYEQVHGLPRCLLFAVGSRETNLTNEVGDGGHGHGVWQLDDRSHTIPAGFDVSVSQQCQTAAVMLADLIGQHGVDGGLDAYNSGRPTDAATTGGDYGPDVMARLSYLQTRFPAAAATAQTGGTKVVPQFDPPIQIASWCSFIHPTLGACFVGVQPDGAIDCDPANAYLGGPNGKPYFTGRTAALVKAVPGGYEVTDTQGEHYGTDPDGNFSGF